MRFHRSAVVVSVATAALVSGACAGAVDGSGGAGETPGTADVISIEGIHDAELAAAYTVQVLPLYIESPTMGIIEVHQLPSGKSAAALVSDLWDAQDAWARMEPATPVYVVTFKADEGSFVAPRPRPGVSSEVSGDTFVLMVDPVALIESKATTDWSKLGKVMGLPVLYSDEVAVAPITDEGVSNP